MLQAAVAFVFCLFLPLVASAALANYFASRQPSEGLW